MSRVPVFDPRRIVAGSLARIVFGGVLLLGMASVIVAALDGPQRWFGVRVDAAHLLGGSWIAAAVAAGVTRTLAARLPWAPAVHELLVPGLVVPVVGLAVVLPLSLHLALGAIVGDVKGFDGWVQTCLVITGPTHVVFAALCATRVQRLVAGQPARTPGRIWALTMLTSCIPFALLLLPPAIVALTSIPILPLLYAMEGWVRRHCDEVAELPPAAVVLARRRSP